MRHTCQLTLAILPIAMLCACTDLGNSPDTATHESVSVSEYNKYLYDVESIFPDPASSGILDKDTLTLWEKGMPAGFNTLRGHNTLAGLSSKALSDLTGQEVGWSGIEGKPSWYTFGYDLMGMARNQLAFHFTLDNCINDHLVYNNMSIDLYLAPTYFLQAGTELAQTQKTYAEAFGTFGARDLSAYGSVEVSYTSTHPVRMKFFQKDAGDFNAYGFDLPTAPQGSTLTFAFENAKRQEWGEAVDDFDLSALLGVSFLSEETPEMCALELGSTFIEILSFKFIKK